MYRQLVPVEDGVVAIVRDISARKKEEARISQIAYHDALTGLPNRILLDDRINQAMLYAQRHGRYVTVLFIDLDDFKIVNDTLGHQVGDELLRVISKRMLDCLRQTDTVVRLGGDEFVILLVDQPDAGDALMPTLQRLRSAISMPVYIADRKLSVTSSIGVARYPGDGDTSESLVMNADEAMYMAKAEGSNNYCFYADVRQKKLSGSNAPNPAVPH